MTAYSQCFHSSPDDKYTILFGYVLWVWANVGFGANMFLHSSAPKNRNPCSQVSSFGGIVVHICEDFKVPGLFDLTGFQQVFSHVLTVKHISGISQKKMGDLELILTRSFGHITFILKE